jgi:hypothetical protein
LGSKEIRSRGDKRGTDFRLIGKSNALVVELMTIVDA